MIVGTPIWFWLGLAVLIPVLIHLWNKRSGKPRLLGTFRFLPEQSFASAKRIELHEIPLMLVRMLIVILVVFLLAGLFLEKEVKGVERVIVSEALSGQSVMAGMENGVPVVSVSSGEVEQKGWWNVLEQLEYRQQPERITIRGDLSEARFRGARPNSNAMIDWEPLDSLYTDELILTAWEFDDEQYRALIQRRTNAGIQTLIEEVAYSEIQNNGIQAVEKPRLILNPENEAVTNLGLEYVAERWGIEVEEQSVTELAQLELEGQIFRLLKEKGEPRVEGMVEANSTFGISLSVKEMRADVQSQKVLIATRNEHMPFIYIDNGGSMVINGTLEKELRSWVYAGIGYLFLKESFGLHEFLTPELIEAQRDPAFFTLIKRLSAPTEQRSARLWLMGLLALCWLVERWLAPGRGM